MVIGKQNTILITGATGFVGNHLIRELLQKNLVLIATSRSKADANKFPWINDVEFIPSDLNEARDDWYSHFGEPDLLIHLAWEGLPNYKELFHCERNLPSNYVFLKNMVENGLARIVVAGTCFEYGMHGGELREDMDTMPNTPYAVAKDSLRQCLEQLNNKIDFDLKWLRLFYMYGKGQNPNSVLSQLQTALDQGDRVFKMSDGTQLRDYLSVEKAANYISRISTQDKVNGVINCCSGKPISIRTLVENYLYQNNKNIKLQLGYYPQADYEPAVFWGNTDKLNKALT